MTTVQRIFNFAAGPAVLPLPVLEEIQRDLVSLPGVGMSILEISHRSETFERSCEARRTPTLGRIPRTKRCFCQGGASLQFSMCRDLLRPRRPTTSIGSWRRRRQRKEEVGAVNVSAPRRTRTNRRCRSRPS